MEKIIFKNPDGFILKDKGGKTMNPKIILRKWAKKVILETKVGKFESLQIDNPSKLPVNIKQLVINEFYPVALTAFSQNKSEQFQTDVAKHLFDVDILMLAFNDNAGYQKGKNVERGIAFRTYTSFEVNGKKILYVEGTAVDPAFQSKGFYQAFSKAIISSGNYDYVTSRTQNPVVITAMTKVFGQVAPINKKPNKEEKQICEILARRLNMNGEYNPQTLLCKGIYGRMLTGVKPCINNAISKKMNRILEIEKGDCLLAISKTKEN